MTTQVSAPTPTTTTATELPQRAEQLLDLLRQNASRTEQDRRLPDDTIQALSEAGLFKITMPKRFGGHEANFETFMKVTSTLGQACGSTAWVTTLLNVGNWIAGLFPDEAQQEIFGADLEAKVCGVFAPSSTTEALEGGLKVTGKWGFASGCLHAQWCVVGIPIVDESGEQIDQGLAMVPMEQVAIEDTWYVAGMRGTGSNTLVIEDIFVPHHRILSLSKTLEGQPATPHTDEALYRSAFVPVAALVLGGPQLGLVKGALNGVLASLAKGKGISYTFYDRATDAGSTQIAMAQAASLIDTAELHLFRAAADIDTAAARGEQLDLETRTRVRMDVGVVANRTREAMDLLLSVQGAGSFAEVNPIQQKWRDLETSSRHAIVNPLISSEIYGRALLGIQEQVTPMI